MGKESKPTRRLQGISYGRVSTVNQMLDVNGFQREDASPHAQKIRCQDHVRFLSHRTGYEYAIIEHLSDEGFSAKNVNRPSYQKMWQLIASGTINFIVASELSRLSRSVTDFLDLVSHCQKNNVDLIIIGLDLDTSTPFGRVIVVILVALAQFEREMTSMRVRENALTRLLNDGKINGSSEILGLDRDPNKAGHFIKNEREMSQVENLMKIFLQVPGKAKLLEEAAKLGIQGKKGQPLTMHSITILLENARWRYRGLWPANRENKGKDDSFLPENKRYREVKLPHGPLFDLNLLDQVVEKFSRETTIKAHTGSNSYFYLLSGILVHENGGAFTGACGKNRQYRYYHNETQRMRLSCEQIDDLVKKTVKEYFLNSPNYENIIRQGFKKLQSMIPGIDERLNVVNRELTKLTAEERQLNQVFTAEKLEDPTYATWLKGQIKNLDSERKRLENEAEELRRKKARFLNKQGYSNLKDSLKQYVSEGFDTLPTMIQRTVIERIIPTIVVKNTNQIEIRIATPFDSESFFVTSEEKSTTEVKGGGRDGTRTRGLRRDRAAL